PPPSFSECFCSVLHYSQWHQLPGACGGICSKSHDEELPWRLQAYTYTHPHIHLQTHTHTHTHRHRTPHRYRHTHTPSSGTHANMASTHTPKHTHPHGNTSN